MRILHVYKRAYPDSFGGVEQFIHQLALSTSLLGYNCQILSLTNNAPRDLNINSSYQLILVKENFEIFSTGFSLSFIQKFNELCNNVDIIHFHFPWPFYDIIHLLLGVKVPLIVTYHSDIIRQKYLAKIYQPIGFELLARANAIVCTSQNYQNSSPILSNYYNKTHVIPIGLDPCTYPRVSNQRLLYWSSRLPVKFFLFIGVLRYYKGLSTLVEACKFSELKVVIIGAGPEENEIKRRVVDNNIKSIIFLGSLSDDDKNAILKLSYGVVCPSNKRSEAFGVSLLEGLMFGKPLISCEIGTGTSFVNINNSTGFVVPPDNPSLLRLALYNLWNNEEIAIRFGKNSHNHFYANFTAKVVAKKYSYLYKHIA